MVVYTTHKTTKYSQVNYNTLVSCACPTLNNTWYAYIYYAMYILYACTYIDCNRYNDADPATVVRRHHNNPRV